MASRRINASPHIRVVKGLTGLAFISLCCFIFSIARPVYPTTSCMINQRVLAQACEIYAQDHQGRLPRQWSDIDTYLAGETDFQVCPLSRHAFHGKLGYGMNSNITGHALESIQEPASVLLTADSVRPRGLIASPADIDLRRHIGLIGSSRGGEATEIEDTRASTRVHRQLSGWARQIPHRRVGDSAQMIVPAVGLSAIALLRKSSRCELLGHN